MSKLIIVCGLGGSGKTTTAKALSKKMNIVCFYKDSLKAALFDELEFSTNDTYKLFFKLAEEQIKNNIDLIIEAPFVYREDIKLIDNWLKKYRVNLFCVICEIDEKIRTQRIEVRPRHICHAKADIRLKEKTEKELFDFLQLPGKHIKVSTNKSIDNIVSQIISEIK